MSKIYKIIIAVSRSFSVPLFGFLISLLGIKFYGKEYWGDFIYTFTWILLFAFLANFGNKDYLLRKYSNNPSEIAVFFTNNFLSRMLILLVSFVLFIIFPTKIAIASTILIFLIFIYQSLDSLVIYHQLFLRQLIAEVIGFALIITFFLSKKPYHLETIIYVYCISYGLKISIFLGNLKTYFSFKKGMISIQELKKSFAFFLIVFSGFIASKIDLYVVNLTMSKEHISEYQIGITAFLLLQSLAYLIILPFNKHLYRLNKDVIQKIKKQLAYISVPVVVTGTISIWFILEKIAKLDLSLVFYMFGALSSLPTYFYIMNVMLFYKQKKERIIIKISFIAAICNLILSFILIHNYGIIGGVISVFVTQLVVLVFYKLYKE